MKTASPGPSADFQSVSPTCSRQTVGLAGRAEARRRRRITNPRYGAARPSRNQYVPTTDEHGWTRIRESLSSSVLIRVHLWLKKSSRAATISGDTDRLQVCATDAASKLNTCRGEGRAFAAPKRLRPRRRGEGE